MNRAQSYWSRAKHSAVIWSWIFNAFRLASGIFLLPLLLRELPKAELGMYYVFLRLIALVPIIDFGFSVTIGRYVSYAMGGAGSLQPQGLDSRPAGERPNYQLLWKLLASCRALYQRLSILALFLLGVWGTYNVSLNAGNTAWPAHTWAAWALTLTAAILDIYLGWWNVYLRGMNQVVQAARLAVLGYGVQITIACSLLLVGFGLLSIPLGSLTGNLLQRFLSRRACLKVLNASKEQPDHQLDSSLLKTMWPNTWRVGLQFFSTYLAISVPGLVFAGVFGADEFAAYGVSMQIMTICSGMAMVWTTVKWPVVGQCRAKNEYLKLQRLLRPRVWLQIATFLLLAGAAILLGPELLRLISSDKSLLPAFWLSLLALNAFLESQFSFWGTLISTENRIPYLWPSVITNAASMGISISLAVGFGMGASGLVIGPLVAGLAFNYWYWLFAGARSIRTTWFRFMFGGTTG